MHEKINRFINWNFLDQVCSVAWCPDPDESGNNPNLVSAADDGSVRLWRYFIIYERRYGECLCSRPPFLFFYFILK